jgi:hypothetical protein
MMNGDYLLVEDRPHLVRDPASGAVLARDRKKYEEHRKSRGWERRVVALENQMQSIEDKLDRVIALIGT